MAVLHLLKNNFARGELSPRAWSRVDLELYGGSLELCRNFIAFPHGSKHRRPGTKFIGFAKYHDREVAFLDFVYTTTGDAYVLEFGHQYIRFWADGGYLAGNTLTITGITNASTGVVSYTGTDPSNGQHVYITGVVGMHQVNNRRFTIANVNAGANTFELQGVDTTDYGTYSSGGEANIPYEVATTYTEDEVQDIQFVQVGDSLFLAHPSHKPALLTRNAHTNWSLDDIDFVDGPYMPINDTDTACYSSAALTEGTTTTLTFSAVAGVNGGAGFQATDIGRHIRVKATGSPAIWTFGVISDVNSTTSIDVDWLRGVSTLSGSGGGADTGGGTLNSPGTKSWRLGSFSDTTGYPACVEVFESRACWARTSAEPRTVFFSRTGLPFDYAPSNGDSTVTADMGMSLAILAGRMDRILWLEEAPRLQIGTSSGIRTIGGSDTQQALSPTNISQRLEVTYGASSRPPAPIGSALLYPSRFGMAIRNLTYSFEQNSLVAPDISILHEHLLDRDIHKMVVAEIPDPVVWVLKNDGTVVGITYDAAQSIASFHRHDFGGDSAVKDISIIPGEDRDELWLTIERTICGETVRTVEQLSPNFSHTDDHADAFFVDYGLTYDGSPTNQITGLWHLRGESVDVLADGAVMTGLSVSDEGVLTLPNGQSYSKVHIGLNIIAEGKTLRPPYQAGDGWILGRRQQVVKVYADVYRSGPLKVGTEQSHQEITFRFGNEPFGTPPALRSGSYNVPVDDKWRGGGQAYWKIDVPLPCTLRSLLVQIDTEDVG